MNEKAMQEIKWEDIPEVVEQTEEEMLANYLMNEFPGCDTFIPISQKIENNDVLNVWKNTETPKSGFLNFTDSPFYYVKIVGAPVESKVHFINDGDKKKKVDCEGYGCQYCLDGNKQISKYNIDVEDKEDGQRKILECGTQLLGAIKKIILKDNNFSNYYIKVEKDGLGQSTKYYAKKVD